MTAEKDLETTDVVRVLVGQEDRVHIVRGAPEDREAPGYLERRYADIHQDRHAAGPNQRAVARRTRGEDEDLHSYTPVEPNPPLPRSEAVRSSERRAT